MLPCYGYEESVSHKMETFSMENVDRQFSENTSDDLNDLPPSFEQKSIQLAQQINQYSDHIQKQQTNQDYQHTSNKRRIGSVTNNLRNQQKYKNSDLEGLVFLGAKTNPNLKNKKKQKK